MAYLGDILQPALPVKHVASDSLVKTSTPATAEEYLQQVVLEAAECDDIKVAEVDGARFASKQTPVFHNPPGCTAAPPNVAPSSEWQQQQAADFSSARRVLARVRALAANGEASLPPLHPRMPDRGDEKGWHRFCFGSLPKGTVTKRQSSLHVNAECTNEGMPPLVSVMVQMNQPTVEHVLEHHVGWLQSLLELGTGMTAARGRWLYALLAALELPLTPDVCFLLRSLARTCAALRASAVQEGNTDSEAVTTLNLLICIVALYFRQGDLADH